MAMLNKMTGFEFFANSRTIFGAGSFGKLAQIIDEMASSVLIVRGGASLEESGKLDDLEDALDEKKVMFYEQEVSGEPTIELIDLAAQEMREKDINLVVAIGGGSVMDAGKAISAMIPCEDSIENYLEGIGKKRFDGVKVPFIAVPTTAGTGSEATKNAVIAKYGKNGYKKSLRHDNLIPDIALIDPELALSCPDGVTIAGGLDALTQLLESFLSPKASAMTDALAIEGIRRFGIGFDRAVNDGENDLDARSEMAMAAYLSGIGLANAGLGIVHGIAGIVGGWYEIAHGVICGSLIAAAMRKNVQAMRRDESMYVAALVKCAVAGRILCGKEFSGDEQAVDGLMERLELWVAETGIPKLSEFGVKAQDVSKIAKASENKNNPVQLSETQITEILSERL